MSKRFFALALCAALLAACVPTAAAADANAGFYGVGTAAGVEIRPVTASGAAVAGVARDADGDGTGDVFFPGAEALAVTLADTAPGAMYLLTVSSPEQTLYADQQTGGGALTFRAAFALPQRTTALTVEIGSTAAGAQKLAVPLFYTPSVTAHSPGYDVCRRDGSCPLAAFRDLDSAAWYHDGVHDALASGIMNGVGGGRFAPAAPTGRGMIVTMLWRLEGMPAAQAASFRDVVPDAWYAPAVGWAAAEHIVDGYDAARFGPDDSISREQLAVILFRYARYKGEDTSGAQRANLGAFIDAEHVSPWALAGVQWALAAGLISGTGNERLSPRAAASRAQVATILTRYTHRT